jgi:hypothetical protein
MRNAGESGMHPKLQLIDTVTISEATWAIMRGFARNGRAVSANSSSKGE